MEDQKPQQFESFPLAIHWIVQHANSRTERNSLFLKWKDLFIPVEKRSQFDQLMEDELFHISHVKECWETFVSHRFPKVLCQHDFTKDAFYFLVTIVALSFGHKSEILEIFEQELKYHYSAEPHHPAFEMYNETRLEEKDIAEMALDRLSRNLQFNKGIYSQNLESYLPEFIHDKEARMKLYLSFIEEFKGPVLEIWEKHKKKQ